MTAEPGTLRVSGSEGRNFKLCDVRTLAHVAKAFPSYLDWTGWVVFVGCIRFSVPPLRMLKERVVDSGAARMQAHN